MSMKKKHSFASKAVGFIVILSLMIACAAPAFADESADDLGATAVRPANSGAQPSTPGGFIDRGVDFSNVNDYTYTIGGKGKLRDAALPASYDLRTTYPSLLTAVRDQGDYGDCWAFASCASMSSSLVRNGLASSAIMLSARQLAFAVYNTDTFSSGSSTPLDGGGDYLMAAAALSKWFGPVTEASAPEPTVGTYNNPGTGSNLWSMPASYYKANNYHLENMYILPAPLDSNGNLNQNNVNTVKSALMTYGPLATSYFAGTNPMVDYNSNYAYYTTSTQAQSPADHGVTIIGWNDNYPAANFTSPSINPPGNGAWLIQNSWGGSWGHSGTFWLSYYERTMGTSYYMSATTNGDYSMMDYYDELGWIGNGVQVAPSASVYAANIFDTYDSSSTGKSFAAVGFYTYAPGLNYEISAYAEPNPGNPTSGTQMDIASGSATNITGTATYAGYQTIPLTNPVQFVGIDRFSVIVKISGPSGQLVNMIPVECAESNGDNLTIAAGQSFVSTGSGTAWRDLTSIYGTSSQFSGMGNVPIKALFSGFDKSGTNGWYKKSNGTYKYFVNGTATIGWKKISSKWYYFNKNGIMLAGWQKISGKWYYFGKASDGKMKTGWQKISSKWYYFGKASDGKMKTGWQKISGKWYYFGKTTDGKMKTGWQKIGSKRYYFASNGVWKK